MKTKLLLLVASLISASSVAAQDKGPQVIVTGLKNPESVAVGFKNRVFVSEIGEFGKDGDGRIVEIKNGKIEPFADGLDDPKGMVIYQNRMYVTDKARVWKIDPSGKASVFLAAEAFPQAPQFLNDIAVDEKGNLCVSDSGDLKGSGGVIYRADVDMKGNVKGKVTVLADAKKIPQLKTPNGLLFDGMSFLLVLDFGSGDLWRVAMRDGSATKIADGFDGGDGLAWDYFGRLYITSWKTGKMWVIGRPGAREHEIKSKWESAADLCLDAGGNYLLVPDMKAGTLSKMPIGDPLEPVDASPLPLKTEVAFPKLKWTGWEGVGDDGKVRPLRPILLTHANDGTDRVFVMVQQGPIHVFANDQGAASTKVFLDITKKVYYSDKENEQGLLGLAFHPKYKTNGEFFVFYTVRQPKLTNVVSRFRVKKDNPDEADPNSEEEILRIQHKYWNHDGGTICFGPDGYLYVAVGDGGSGGDPDRNGQKLDTMLGKILRIDVNNKSDGKAYAIPDTNPFVTKADTGEKKGGGKKGGGKGGGKKDKKDPDAKVAEKKDGDKKDGDKKDGAKKDGDKKDGDKKDVAKKDAPKLIYQKGVLPEIFAYGFRNPWRMAFDRKTGKLWAGDVGQNLYEEIDIVVKGGNYGWGLREGLHPFNPEGVGENNRMLEPIWEYHHDIGKSITGGPVYRGKRLPELDGAYIYGDYVSKKIWALWYDESKSRVVANRPIADQGKDIFSFGEDEQGDVYLLTSSIDGKSIYRFARSK
jgi:glucose/arabinose dehydrogenase